MHWIIDAHPHGLARLFLAKLAHLIFIHLFHFSQ